MSGQAEAEYPKFNRILRLTIWARIKGELEGVLNTYWGEEDEFDLAEKAIEKFLCEMENIMA